MLERLAPSQGLFVFTDPCGRPVQTYAIGVTETNHKNSLLFPLKFAESVAY